jgi:hypothetical protein
VGWALWRDTAALPEELVFKVNYLGGEMPTFALNFSRPGGQVVAQYYNFLRLGREGYRRVQQTCRDVAVSLSSQIAELGPFRLLTDGSQLPVFAFVVDGEQPFSVFDVSAGLREEGWLVPAYTFPAHREDITALRIVVRNGRAAARRPAPSPQPPGKAGGTAARRRIGIVLPRRPTEDRRAVHVAELSRRVPATSWRRGRRMTGRFESASPSTARAPGPRPRHCLARAKWRSTTLRPL